jgi:hypothetical protein
MDTESHLHIYLSLFPSLSSSLSLSLCVCVVLCVSALSSRLSRLLQRRCTAAQILLTGWVRASSRLTNFVLSEDKAETLVLIVFGRGQNNCYGHIRQKVNVALLRTGMENDRPPPLFPLRSVSSSFKGASIDWFPSTPYSLWVNETYGCRCAVPVLCRILNRKVISKPQYSNNVPALPARARRLHGNHSLPNSRRHCLPFFKTSGCFSTLSVLRIVSRRSFASVLSLSIASCSLSSCGRRQRRS